MYLKHFEFTEFPFTLTSDLKFFCNLESYKDALNMVMVSLKNGDGLIKITGEVGVGKTILCRKLLTEVLDTDEYLTIYMANSPSNAIEIQKIIANKLEVSLPNYENQYTLLALIHEKLIIFREHGKRVVVVADEAHTLSTQALEGLRLLTNLDSQSQKLVTVILFGQPELDKRLRTREMRQLTQRIVTSYLLPSLKTKEELDAYLNFRLTSAGYCHGNSILFSPEALKLLVQVSRGIPRLINILCHKALLFTYGYNQSKVNGKFMKMAIENTDGVYNSAQKNHIAKIVLISVPIIIIISIIGHYFFR